MEGRARYATVAGYRPEVATTTRATLPASAVKHPTTFTKFQWILVGAPATELRLPELPAALDAWKQDLLANITEALNSVRLWG